MPVTWQAILNPATPAKIHSPPGETNIRQGRRFPCLVAGTIGPWEGEGGGTAFPQRLLIHSSRQFFNGSMKGIETERPNIRVGGPAGEGRSAKSIKRRKTKGLGNWTRATTACDYCRKMKTRVRRKIHPESKLLISKVRRTKAVL
jgi:hypothetical protein